MVDPFCGLRSTPEFDRYAKEHSCHAVSFMPPRGDRALMLAFTPDSTRIFNKQVETGDFTGPPAWFEYHILSFLGTTLLSFKEMVAGYARAKEDSVSLGEHHPRERVADLMRVSLREKESYYEPLRRIIQSESGSNVWVEVTSGCGFRAYRCLEVQMKSTSLAVSQGHTRRRGSYSTPGNQPIRACSRSRRSGCGITPWCRTGRVCPFPTSLSTWYPMRRRSRRGSRGDV
eukprot:TRINITY_DN77012_c0_g1_i1.p1 TRINITY_DN77012_c0_g1~~TRINITY_DN77012_c0_g1_i1.p1  ORF type:complete len:230 (-),score=4.24 TRINITY_DN77012_c0_g1_i1:186-875(-)